MSSKNFNDIQKDNPVLWVIQMERKQLQMLE